MDAVLCQGEIRVGQVDSDRSVGRFSRRPAGAGASSQLMSATPTSIVSPHCLGGTPAPRAPRAAVPRSSIKKTI